jgi:hypothetical protein
MNAGDVRHVSIVEGCRGDVRGSVAPIMYRYSPGLTADLAVFDIILIAAATGIDADGVRLAAVRTDNVRARIGGAVAERKVTIEIEVVGPGRLARITRAVVVEGEAHFEA